MSVKYIGKDLEAMSFAVNYHRLIFEKFRPFLGNKIVEVGAGTGSFSELLTEAKPTSLALVEPSEMFESLKINSENLAVENVRLFNNIFEEVRDKIKKEQSPDSVIYVNVLEHIEDDERELKFIYETLGESGRLFIFVPAFEWLYGEFDKAVGHFRRYTREDLENKCRAQKFKIIRSEYFDLVGIIPWWIKYRLFKSSSLNTGAVHAYDKFVVPLAGFFESRISLPIGKNILLVAEKDSSR